VRNETSQLMIPNSPVSLPSETFISAI